MEPSAGLKESKHGDQETGRAGRSLMAFGDALRLSASRNSPASK